MKTSIYYFLTLVLFASLNVQAAKKVTVQAVNDDISYSLDLKAVASVFGDARNLQEFEDRLNDADAQLSNLDLNSDGNVDYIRVVETTEGNTHLVVLQAVLDRDIFQDIATIVVEKDRSNKTYVQVVGDPFIYGANYIIDPVFYITPRIFSWFWASTYRPWISPYYWGYYPNRFHYRRPVQVNIYLSHVSVHISRYNRFNYVTTWRNPDAYRMYSKVSRNDYGVRYPDRTYTRRNVNVSNRYEMDRVHNKSYVTRSSSSTRQSVSDRSASSSSTSRGEVRKTDRSPETISREVKSTRQQSTQQSTSRSNSTQDRSVRSTPSSTKRSSSTTPSRSGSSSNSGSRSSSSNDGGRR
jgi:hypothetical protein